MTPVLQGYEDFLEEKVKTDPRWIVMTAENRALIRNLPAKIGDHFIDTGITEQTMIGMAAGLALRGRRVVTHALASFHTMRAFEFIRTDVGLGRLPVKIVGFIPGLLSDGNGPTHQALEDIGLMRLIPGMKVFAPGSLEDFLIGLKTVFNDDAPCYIRYTPRSVPFSHSRDFQLGKAEKIKSGSDLSLLTYGTLLPEAWAATEILEKRGVSVELYNMRFLSPIDTQAIVETATKTKNLVTLEDHFQRGALHTAVCETLVEHRLSPKVSPISFDAKWFRAGELNKVLETEGLTGEKIASRILERLK